jgi:serine protease AprX
MVSVWLSFYRNNLLNTYRGGVFEQVQLQVSSDGGIQWTTLATYSGVSNLGAATDSFDISAYASANTRIRFVAPTIQTGVRYLYVDDIEIAFARPSAFLAAVKADQLSLSGQGITVAVVDSGISTKNNDFKSGTTSHIIAEWSFGQQGSTNDLHGHGTHVAGILGGNGAASGEVYRGVAPGVNLINLRVSDKDGRSYESDVVNSLQWVYDNKDRYNIRVVNLSLNSTVAQSYHTSPLSAAVEILWFNGIVVVVSAGNNGTGEGPVTIYPPANDPFVITVGATEDRSTADLWDDNLAVFSAYGTTDDGFAKPDLVAPGRNVIAPLSDKASTVYIAYPLHRVGDAYLRLSGTSMSAPVVSGAVALLLQDEPDLTPDQVKYRLMSTANQDWTGYEAAKAGAGTVDVYAAVYETTTDSANQGILPSQMLFSGEGSLAVNSVGWNSVGWNSVGWNSVGWNSVGWNSVGWNASTWDE